jgi:hypothetical protein
MASAYRNASRLSDESDSDMSAGDLDMLESSSVDSEAGDDAQDDNSQSSSSDDEEGEQSTKTHPPTTDLRNRILMLTSRGVSHR